MSTNVLIRNQLPAVLDTDRQTICDLRTFTHGLTHRGWCRLMTTTGLAEYNMSTPDPAIQILIVPHATAVRPDVI